MYQHHLNQHLLNRASAWRIEQLEQRTLLSGGVFDVSHVRAYTPSSGDISDVKHGPLGNFGEHLAGLYTEYKRFVRNGGATDHFASKAESDLQTDGSRVAVTLRTTGSMTTLADRIRMFGGELIFRNGIYKTIDAWVPIGQLSTLARDAAVLNAAPVYRAVPRFQGIADNQADPSENADSARATFGVDGTGVKVGVLSDSVNEFEGGLADSVASGDLPPGVQVVQDGVGGNSTDEGRAMLELIHDIAPGASLAFATANSTPTEFAHNILELARAGCKVIVDDVGYVNEPFFQEGIVSQAITSVTEDMGVSYFSAVGNSGTAGYQIPATFVSDINNRQLIDFDRSDHVDTRLRLTVAGTSQITFQWDNPYNGVVGAATTDLDINFIDPISGAIVASGNDANLATTNPVEIVTVPAGTYDVEISVADRVPGTALPTVIKFSSFSDLGVIDPEYRGFRTTGIGHGSGQDTISVGAVPFSVAPPFNNNEVGANNEGFSTVGTLTYLFKSDGERRDKALMVHKPDVSGIDGVNTSFFGSDTNKDKDRLPNFSGTSAAAPNVAAVAALMLELNPDATPTDIKNALIQSARNNPLNGQLKGKFDDKAGYGLIDALLALHEVSPGTIVADIGRVVPDSVTKGIGELSIRFSNPVTGFSLDDLELLRGKVKADNLLDDPHVKLTTNGNQTFILSGLSLITSKRGTYFLNFNPVDVVDAKTGTIPALNGSTSFFVNGKPTGLTAIAVSGSEIDLNFTDNTPNESGFQITRAIDADFTRAVVTFRTKANVTHYKDTGLSPATQYFYRVRAIVSDGAPNPTTDSVNAFTLTGNENIVDNRSEGATVKGAFTLVSDTDSANGGDYLLATPKGSKSVTFTPTLDSAGTYFVYVRSVKGADRATNVQVELLVDGDVKKTFSLNERTNNGYVLLGQFKLGSGSATAVRITNAGANGTVAADAVRFQRTVSAASGIKVAATGNLFSETAVDKKDDVLA